MEILDQYISLKCEENYAHFILFPFVSNPAMYEKSKELEYALNNRIKVHRFKNELKEQLTTLEWEQIKTKHTSIRNFNTLLEEFHCDTWTS